jgi:hypothetical protein
MNRTEDAAAGRSPAPLDSRNIHAVLDDLKALQLPLPGQKWAPGKYRASAAVVQTEVDPVLILLARPPVGPLKHDADPVSD